jgi:nucleotide-binding universal stress UspA family protein
VNLATDAESICLKAAGLARRMGGRCVLLHVVQMPVGLSRTETVKHPATGESMPASELMNQDALKHLDPLLDLMRMQGAEVELELRSGQIADEIADSTRALEPLMVVVGSDLPSGLRRLFVGSVTEAVIQAVDAPVLVVKGDPTARSVMITGQMQAAAENDG